MMTTNDFDTLKRKVYLAYHQDGILDLVAGAVVLGFGLVMLTDNMVFLVFGWVAMMLYFLLKQRLTIPRFGFVRFVPEQTVTRQGWVVLGLGVLVLIVFAAGALVLPGGLASPTTQAWVQQYHMVPLSGLLFGLPALVAAAFLGLKRFYVYALLAVGLPALGAGLKVDTYLPIVAIGLVMLAAGGTLLVSFLRRYPLDDQAGGNAHG